MTNATLGKNIAHLRELCKGVVVVTVDRNAREAHIGASTVFLWGRFG
jgi:hypothetical protein